MTPSHLPTEWARLLLGSLRAAGVQDVVISPGSRSTPFAWAALQDPGLVCRGIVDERSAAFFALGHARMTGRPVLLICTSGSAAGHYFPAIIEADEASVPLLILTADRPLELQHAAAPQTIDQVKLYGDHARAYFEVGTPDPDPRMIRALPRLAEQAVFTTLYPLPGPVHLNARARKPLEPVIEGTGTDSPAATAADARATAPPHVTPDPGAIEELADRMERASRGLIVCGPALPRDAADAAILTDLARLVGFPVAAEPASQLRFAAPGGDLAGLEVDALAALLEVDRFVDTHRPDLVIQVGRPPTASAWHRALARWDTERWVLAPHGWPVADASGRVLTGPVTATLEALLELLEARDGAAVGGRRDAADRTGESDRPGAADRPGADAGWRDRLRTANALAWSLVDAAVRDGFSEGAAIRDVVDRLPEGAVLALGNSLPIREVERFVPAGDRGLRVWSQRGANGIDGLVSGAAGAAVATGRPTALLLGDVSFLHDVGGLATARHLHSPLAVVVLNNGGGRIFERLPLADLLGDDPAFETWLTPPELDVEAACRAFGVRYVRADDRASLRAGLDAALAARVPDGGDPAGGATRRDPRAPSLCTVIEVMVPPDGTTTHQKALRARLAAELEP